MGGVNSGRKKMSANEMKARHERFAVALEAFQSVTQAAQHCGLSRQWGYEVAKRLGWERGGWGRVVRKGERIGVGEP
jgi:hypothetical protein